MRTLLWDYTEECNLRCIHCYNSENNRKRRKTIYTEECKEFFLGQLEKLKINHVHLLGGEPLCSENIFDFIRQAKCRNIKISINTNGTLLSRKVIDTLIELNVDQLTISLDGADSESNDEIRGKGTFDIVMYHLKLLSQELKKTHTQLFVQLATVITRINKETIHRLPLLANQFDIKVIDVMPVAIRGEAKKNIDRLGITCEEYFNVLSKMIPLAYFCKVKLQIDCKSKVLEAFARKNNCNMKFETEFDSCQAGDRIIYMDAEGNLFPCSPLSMTKLGQEMRESIFDDLCVLKVRNFKERIEQYFSNIQLPKTCKKCEKNNSCDFGKCGCSISYELCELAMEHLEENHNSI